jgi:hypothetical protein
MAKKETKLTDKQIAFITNKVESLGSYELTCRFYNRNDFVGETARQIAEEKYGIPDDEEPTTPKTTKKKTAKKKTTTVKHKRKIDIDEVLKDD